MWLYFEKAFLLYKNIDEGLLLDGAHRILNNQIPLKDFFYFHFPGDIYLLALFFKLFGESYFTAKLMLTFFAILSCVAILIMVYKFSKDPILTSIVSLFYCGTTLIWMTISHNNLGEFFVITAIGLLFLSIKKDNNKWLFFAGVMSGITCLIHESRGAPLLGLSFIYFLVRGLKNRNHLKSVFYNITYFLTGVSVILITALIYLIRTNSLAIYIDTMKWVWTNYRTFNYYPFIYDRILFIEQHISQYVLKNVFLYMKILFLITATLLLPLLISISLIITYIYKAFKRGISYKDEILLLLSFCYLVLFFSVFYKPVSTNLWMLPFPALISLLLCVEWLLIKQGEKKKIIIAVRSILMMFIVFLFYYSFKDAFLLLPLRECEIKIGVNKIKSVYQSECADIYYLNKIISQDPEEAIFVYHWSPMLYFLLNKKNATSFDSYVPVSNTSQQIQQILKELKAHKPLYIIKDTYIKNISDPSSGLYWWFPFLIAPC